MSPASTIQVSLSVCMLLPNDYELTQRAFEIEAGVARLLRRDRAACAEQAAAKHVIAGAVNGFDAEQLFALVAERRELPLLAIPPHHHAVVAGSEPHHLQLVRP